MALTTKISSLETSSSLIRHATGYKYLIFLSMIYLSIMLCNAVLTNRFIGIDSLFVLGGTFTSPFIFILDDIVAEIYGYRIACSMILYGFAAQTLFIVICQIVLLTPHPSFFIHQESYNYILGISLLRINISGFAAFITANLLNSYILTRWKILLKGKYFWLRSLGSSVFSEALYSFLAIVLMQINSIPFQEIIKVVGLSFSIKAIYSIIFSLPTNWLVNYLKNITGIDVYDFPKNFTPLKYYNLNRGD